jgi:hypothetical protein
MTTFPSDSLGGQNTRSSAGGARSSRARSAIFKKLRNADRRITTLDKAIFYETLGGRFWNGRAGKLKKQRDAWDLKRKSFRELRKAFTNPTP